MASEDSSDSNICYLPPSESSGVARKPRYEKWDKKPTVNTSRDDVDSLRRSNQRNNNGGDRRRYKSGSRDYKRERRSRTTSSSPGRGKERRSRSRRLRSSSGERRKSTKHSRWGRKDSGSSSRERQMKYMRYARRSRSSSRSNSREKQRSHSLHRSSRSTSRNSSSARREKYMNYDRRSRSRSRNSSSERRGRYMNYDRRSRSRSKLSNRDRRGRDMKYARQSRSSTESGSQERKEKYGRESSRDDEDGNREENKAAINANKTQRKGEKKTFYCPLCLIELNSEDTMNSHVNGVKHTKKVIEYNQKVEKEASRGRYLPEMLVYQIPNPEAIKKKVPIRLHEKIKVSADPVVGLDFIQEFIAESDSEMEPYYECQLCGCQGHANMIFGHIMGSKHRQKFAEEVYEKEIKNGQMKYLNMNQKQLLDFARRNQENNDMISRRIRTELSDEKYPWPPGKAPWSIEKGGNGKAPKNVRNWSKNGDRKEDIATKTFIPEDVKVKSEIRMNDEPRSSLPPPNKIGTPKNSEDVKKYIDLGSQLIKMAIECNNAMEESDKMKLKDALGSMATEMRKPAQRREKNNF